MFHHDFFLNNNQHTIQQEGDIIHQQVVERRGAGIRNLMSTLSRAGVCFSGLRGARNGPSHNGNVDCGPINQDSGSMRKKSQSLQLGRNQKSDDHPVLLDSSLQEERIKQ
ncbi:hypothetical protein XENORESO_015544 [Xenotaenia resolanae]|uniref:Uncharacterized protein n=1 Tax=Xenotaenia resolanae TaxID=208358 RepID=A0ABV0WEV2_9TELE